MSIEKVLGIENADTFTAHEILDKAIMKIHELEEELKGFREEAAKKDETSRWNRRLNSILKLCFPVLRMDVEKRSSVTQHPLNRKNGWWNGVTRNGPCSVNGVGDTTLIISSYVGYGNCEEEEITIPGLWLNEKEEFYEASVTSWLIEERKKQIANELRQKEVERIYKIEAAKQLLRDAGEL